MAKGQKVCPTCEEVVGAACRECPHCQHSFVSGHGSIRQAVFQACSKEQIAGVRSSRDFLARQASVICGTTVTPETAGQYRRQYEIENGLPLLDRRKHKDVPRRNMKNDEYATEEQFDALETLYTLLRRRPSKDACFEALREALTTFHSKEQMARTITKLLRYIRAAA